jgi:peroxiredoxin
MSSLPNEIPPFKLTKKVTTTSGVSKKVVIFGLPGAFTPTCSEQQLPGFEELYLEFREWGIDDIYCFTVNDTFVCTKWAEDLGLINVKVIPDGSAEFTIKMGMDVRKDNIGFGIRSWRYAAVYDNGVLEKAFVEEGFSDNLDGDPYEASTPENVLAYVKQPPVGKHIDLAFSDTTDVKETFQ